jgi:hypothetical protein
VRKDDLGGRPPRIDYAEDEAVVQLNVLVPVSVKRALVSFADSDERRLCDEVRVALGSWIASRKRTDALLASVAP